MKSVMHQAFKSSCVRSTFDRSCYDLMRLGWGSWTGTWIGAHKANFIQHKGWDGYACGNPWRCCMWNLQQPRHFHLQEEQGIVLPGFGDLHICSECLLASNGRISSNFWPPIDSFCRASTVPFWYAPYPVALSICFGCRCGGGWDGPNVYQPMGLFALSGIPVACNVSLGCLVRVELCFGPLPSCFTALFVCCHLSDAPLSR